MVSQRLFSLNPTTVRVVLLLGLWLLLGCDNCSSKNLPFSIIPLPGGTKLRDSTQLSIKAWQELITAEELGETCEQGEPSEREEDMVESVSQY